MPVLTISSIELSNFMCHRHFLLSFTKGITCICGRNGAGKSAVMVALGVLLGQRAQALERGNSLAGLIRTGCNQALIRVAINNHLGFHAEKYGTEIVVEKRLRAGGARLVLRRDGRAVDMSAQELRAILDAYGLSFENPLNFLTQEKSKKFLMTAGPGELYDLYYRGSEFKTINEELDESFARLREMEERLRDTAEAYGRVCGELEAREASLRFLSTDYGAELERLELEEMALGLQAELDAVGRCEAALEQGRERARRCGEERAAQQARLDGIRFADTSTAEVDAAIEGAVLRQRSLENDCAEYRREQADVETALQAIRARCRLDELLEELAGVSARLAEADAEVAALEDRDGALAAQAEAEKARNRGLAEKRYALEKQISYLRANAQDAQTRALVEQYARVREMVRAASFSDEVIGPLCDCIVLKEPKWYKPVSIVLRRSLSAYIVFNRRDRELLSNIFRRAGVNFPISLLSSKRAVGGLRTVENSMLGVLELRRDVVLNQLVLFHNVEQIMLVERREDAYRIIKGGSVDGRGRTVECAYTLDGDKVRLTNGSLSDYKARDAGRHWFEDSSTRLRMLEQALAGAAASSAAQDALDANGALLREAHARRRGLEAARRELEARTSSIAEMRENSTEGHERKLAALVRNTAILEAKIGECSGRLEAETGRRRVIEEENARGRETCMRARRECEAEIERAEMTLAMLDSTAAELEAEKRSLVGAVERRVREILAREPGGAAGPENAGNLTGARKDGAGAAVPAACRDCCAPLPASVWEHFSAPRSAADVAGEKRAVRDCIRQARRLQSRDGIEREVAVLARKRDTYLRIRERFERMTGETIAACERRLAKRDEIKDRKTAEAAGVFRELTASGGYEGELLFDHEGRRLDLKMRVHRLGAAGSRATLSGGERSFAGVCFLLSMWRVFRCPVKILDEFDVFMDAVNRRAAVRMLFGFFRESGMQAVLITPLSTDELADDGCEVKVLSKEQP